MPVPDGRRLGLLVASSRYMDPMLKQLRAPGADASGLAEMLSDPGIGGFEVCMLIDTQINGLRRAIERFCAGPGPSDTILVYLSCHGVIDDRNQLYYATIDTERRLLASTAISADWLNSLLEECRARQQILILDCCHSGAFARGAKGAGELALQGRFSGRGRVVLTASRGTEYSFEGPHVVGDHIQSVFTRAIIEGLRSGDADRDRDGLITIDELYHYIYGAVHTLEPRQTPEIWTYGGEGDLLVAQSPRGPVIEPDPVPEYLRMALESPSPRIRLSAVGDLIGFLDHGTPSQKMMAEALLQHISKKEIPEIASLARCRFMTKERVPVENLGQIRENDRQESVDQGQQRGNAVNIVGLRYPYDQRSHRSAPSSGGYVNGIGRVGGETQKGSRKFLFVYLFPFFTSLVLLFSHSPRTKFNALQCVLIDILSIIWIFASFGNVIVYEIIRYYDTEELSTESAVLLMSGFVVPVILRFYCIVALLLAKEPHIFFLGRFARHLLNLDN